MSWIDVIGEIGLTIITQIPSVKKFLLEESSKNAKKSRDFNKQVDKFYLIAKHMTDEELEQRIRKLKAEGKRQECAELVGLSYAFLERKKGEC